MRTTWPTFAAALLAAMPLAAFAQGNSGEPDPLSLQSAPVVETSTRAPFKLFVEGALARVQQRHGLGSFTARRVSLDYSHSIKLGEGWQLGLSDRLDYVDPADTGADSTLNSMRELFAGWRSDDGSTVVDIGRVNLRHGPSYGYNPTDFFRAFAVRAATTVDPFALRENRMGTVMLRAQRLWSSGSASIALAPRLDRDGPSGESLSLDLGATNRRARWLATIGGRASDRFNGEVLVYGEEGKGIQVGASLTALLADAVVAHAEWSHGEDDDLLAVARGETDPRATRSRGAAGVTLSIPTELSLTIEYEYNGFAVDIASWAGVSMPRLAVAGRYLVEAQRRQDNAARRSWLLYATKKSLGTKNLDATALVRINADDDSRLSWLELRYHWPGVDGALQWQASRGADNSQFGLPRTKQSLQVLAAWYF